MNIVYLLLLAGSAVCFFLYAFAGVENHRDVRTLGCGLLLWVLVPLLQQADRLT